MRAVQIHLRRPLALMCLLFLFCVFLILRIVPCDPDPIPWDDRERAELIGRLERKDVRTDAEGAEHLIYTVRTEGRPSLKVQCYMSDGDAEDTEATLGARVLVRGRIRRFQVATNPGEFDSLQYYRILGISCRMLDATLVAASGERDVWREGLYHVRRVFSRSLSRYLNAEDAGVLRAMLLGDKSTMDSELKELYQRSGIIHILAISGLHISIIGMGIFALLKRLCVPRIGAAVLSVLVMLSYGEMCGMTSSAVRAIVMFLLHLLAIVLGRSYDILTALAVAAVLLVVEQPLYLNYSGFLLSFLAVLAIGALLPALTPLFLAEYVPGRNDPRWKKPAVTAAAGILSSLSVALLTLPVYMLYYHTFPVYSVLLNVLILPLMSVVLGAGLLCMIAGLALFPVGCIAGYVDHCLLWLFRTLCLAENALPGATWVTGHASDMQVAVYYLMIAGLVLCVSYQRILEHRRRKKPSGREQRERMLRLALLRIGWLAGALIILSLRGSPALRITLLDVGQGDGIVIEGGGMCFLIDGGSTSRSRIGNYVLVPYLTREGISHLDAAILTHEDEDHMNGLMELLAGDTAVTVDRLLVPRIAEKSRGENYRMLVETASEQGIPVCEIACGDVIASGKMSITCLGPPGDMATAEPNEYSTILYLTCGDFSALFTGDVEGEGEKALLRLLIDHPEIARNITLLKVAHHGSKYTTCEELLDRISPQVAMISCGRNNRYGHPHAELVERLENAGIMTCITAERGALFAETDGRTVRLKGYLDDP